MKINSPWDVPALNRSGVINNLLTNEEKDGVKLASLSATLVPSIIMFVITAAVFLCSLPNAEIGYAITVSLVLTLFAFFAVASVFGAQSRLRCIANDLNKVLLTGIQPHESLAELSEQAKKFLMHELIQFWKSQPQYSVENRDAANHLAVAAHLYQLYSRRNLLEGKSLETYSIAARLESKGLINYPAKTSGADPAQAEM